MLKVREAAPSNIALIKYMGKTGPAGNLPANASLSYSLPHLSTTVEIELAQDGTQDHWLPLKGEDTYPLELSQGGQQRFLKHFNFLKKELHLPAGPYVVRSANNFPSDCGLASSASSFAALTQAAYSLHRPRSVWGPKDLLRMSELSRSGSGSSCRSLFKGWALWQGSAAEPVSGLAFENLRHLGVVTEAGVKEISSSRAHEMVTTSLLFSERSQRANERCEKLLSALHHGHWAQCFETTWAEFWDMHALFETSRPSFGYMTSGSLKILEVVRSYWKEHGDGPLATMDAGPNVHLLFRDQQTQAYEFFKNRLSDNFSVFGSGGP